jgi:hypothetical protein
VSRVWSSASYRPWYSTTAHNPTITVAIIAPHAATISDDAERHRLILPVKRAIPLLAVLIICSGRIGFELRPGDFTVLRQRFPAFKETNARVSVWK